MAPLTPCRGGKAPKLNYEVTFDNAQWAEMIRNRRVQFIGKTFLLHELWSERVSERANERASERMGAAKRASEASSAERVNE